MLLFFVVDIKSLQGLFVRSIVSKCVPVRLQEITDDTKGMGVNPGNAESPPGSPRLGAAHDVVKPDDDLSVRASLYGVLFQSYADKVTLNSKG